MAIVTEAGAFAEFHDALKLVPHEVGFARDFPDEIRDALSRAGVRATHSFLQGSLARGTMVSPLKDVDMVVSLDRVPYQHLIEDALGPDIAMGVLQDALEHQLRPRYPNLRFGERKAHALPIELGVGYPSFDLVPAFETTTTDGDVLIADREDQAWELSNTRQLIRVVAEANQAAGGMLIHVVRMVKHAVRTRLHEKFTGLAVESVAIPAIVKAMPYAEACGRVLEMGAEMLGRPIPDPTGRDDLASKIDAIEPGFTERAREWFETQAGDARRARECAESGDHDQAIAWWRRVFGSPFPLLPTKTSTKAAASALTFGTRAPRPSRAWRRLG